MLLGMYVELYYVNHVYPTAIFMILFKYMFYVLNQKRQINMQLVTERNVDLAKFW